jgi:hypothetical protein
MAGRRSAGKGNRTVKLRIQGNSIRLRISKSELTRFVEAGQLQETIYFGTEPGSELAYILARDSVRHRLDVEASAGQVKVIVPAEMARTWAETDQVGMAGTVDLGVRGKLSILVEKDFACIDRGDEENADTFPNPLAATLGCQA